MPALNPNFIATEFKKPGKILIWGAKGQGKLISEMILDEFQPTPSITIFDPFVDNFAGSQQVKFVNNTDQMSELTSSHSYFIVAIGGDNGHRRTSISRDFLKSGLQSLSVQSRHSLIEASHVGLGVQVMPGAITRKFCKIGDFCILNTSSTVDHDCTLGNGVHIMGGASIAGEVRLDDYCTIGTNATVLPRVTVGRNAFVGAGAVVTRDVDPNSIVVGNPARLLRLKEKPF